EPKSWGHELSWDQGWDNPYAGRTPRMLGDVNGDHMQDLVGFGDDGVWVALSTGSSFAPAHYVIPNFGYNQGWRSEQHLRMISDVNNDGYDDIVAFGNDGVWTARSSSTGFFPEHYVLAEFGYNQHWDIQKHVRLLADMNHDGIKDIVAF